MKTAAYWVKKLDLQPHPEGGFYKETYRSAEQYKGALPARYDGPRAMGTAIYFMITSGNPSHFHRLKSDELWFFHDGSPLLVHLFALDGSYQRLEMGREQDWQAIIPAGSWFAAEVEPDDSYSLISCTVAPGFDFRDFEMAEKEQLLESYPGHSQLISRLCL